MDQRIEVLSIEPALSMIPANLGIRANLEIPACTGLADPKLASNNQLN
jgi:hypothetical protein